MAEQTVPLAVGMASSATEKVTAAVTAAEVGSGLLPVYATPAMIAKMEQAAAELVEAHIPATETSVGIMMNIVHSAATPIGMTVTAKAEITAVEGRKITFAVSAADEAGEIGRGTHERFIVNREKFLAKAAQKAGNN